MAMAQDRQLRCLHLTVMILGIVGVILSIVATAVVFTNESWYTTNGSGGAAKGSALWLLLTTVLISVSGLQGLLLRDGSKWLVGFVVLAVVILIDLGVLIVAVLWLASPFWIIYMIAVFVMELWVTCLRTCCKKKKVNEGMELPVADPGVQENSTVMSGEAYPSVYHNSGLKAPYSDY